MKKFLITAAAIFFSISAFCLTNDAEPVKKVLNNYKKATEKLDTSCVLNLFDNDSKLFGQTKDEGTFSHNLQYQLGPELKDFKSFHFSDYKAKITVTGAFTFSTETYFYCIVPAK